MRNYLALTEKEKDAAIFMEAMHIVHLMMNDDDAEGQISYMLRCDFQNLIRASDNAGVDHIINWIVNKIRQEAYYIARNTSYAERHDLIGLEKGILDLLEKGHDIFADWEKLTHVSS